MASRTSNLTIMQNAKLFYSYAVTSGTIIGTFIGAYRGTQHVLFSPKCEDL